LKINAVIMKKKDEDEIEVEKKLDLI